MEFCGPAQAFSLPMRFFGLLRGLFGIFFFGYADGITAWKMLLYAVIMKFLDTMGQYLVMMCVYAVSRQVTIGFLVPAAGNLLCVVPGQWVSYLPFGLSGLTRIAELNSGAGFLPQRHWGRRLLLSC